MKRLILISAAIATLAGALPLGGPAVARDDDHKRSEPQHRRDGDRGAPPRRDDGRRVEDRRVEDRRVEDRRVEDRGGRRDERGPPRDDPRRGREAYDERGRASESPYPPPDIRPVPARRGGYLPDVYRGGVIPDYQRYRLRPPPRGYSWVRIGRGFALVSMEDGRIFDVIPD
ncbi:RcnB family protein [Phenylobacterium sp.]|uniref:RcnB family protein n=1 Tax=Phenylobacterium sp. TaxID=1871053 RepID=UPI0025F449C9|nr:RcnB family protein [Phenylobacterium sp.]